MIDALLNGFAVLYVTVIAVCAIVAVAAIADGIITGIKTDRRASKPNRYRLSPRRHGDMSTKRPSVARTYGGLTGYDEHGNVKPSGARRAEPLTGDSRTDGDER